MRQKRTACRTVGKRYLGRPLASMTVRSRVLLAGPRGDELPVAATARGVSLIGLERGEIVGVQVAQELTISLLGETSEEHVQELANSPIFEVGQSVGKELLGICKNDDDDVE